MGFFAGFFDKLFGKKKPSVSHIDLNEQGIVIDGKQIDFPMHIDILVELLGKPRATEFKLDPETRAFLERRAGKGMVTNRVNYAWDELGLLAYTNNGKVVSCFSIQLKPTTLKYAPTSVFPGEVTINGSDWFSAMSTGGDGQFLTAYILGSYKITSEKSDFSKDASQCTRDDYNNVDIQIYDH